MGLHIMLFLVLLVLSAVFEFAQSQMDKQTWVVWAGFLVAVSDTTSVEKLANCSGKVGAFVVRLGSKAVSRRFLS